MPYRKNSSIISRIEREAGVPNLAKILADKLEPTDLQTLLLAVYSQLVKNRSPKSVFTDYNCRKVTQPSGLSPALLLEWDRTAFSHLPKGFRSIELSPVCPVGTVSRIAPLSQDWVLTTIRNTEVVSDSTNVLALECARERQRLTRSEPKNPTAVKLACSHRVVRAQRYDSSKFRQHFRLFSLCSSGRDIGNLEFELDALHDHISFYLTSLLDFLGPEVAFQTMIIDFTRTPHYTPILSDLLKKLRKEFGNVNFNLDTDQEASKGYYRRFRFHIYATPPKGSEMELVDGGDTDWTQKLLNNSKERLVISGIGSERVCEIYSNVRASSNRHITGT